MDVYMGWRYIFIRLNKLLTMELNKIFTHILLFVMYISTFYKMFCIHPWLLICHLGKEYDTVTIARTAEKLD